MDTSARMRVASGDGGTIHVPGAMRAAGIVEPARRAVRPATSAACSRATAMNAAFDSGPTRYAHFGCAGIGVSAGRSVRTSSSVASNGCSI